MTTMRSAYLLLVVLGSCRSLIVKCPHNFAKRPVPNEDGGLTIRCCKPLGATQCPPGTEVQPCNRTHDQDWCKPCDKGLVQDNHSGTWNEHPCIHPSICAPEADLVQVNGSQECQCRAAEGYCGEPSQCLKKEPCPEGFKLHHRHCCMWIVTEAPPAVSGRGSSMLPTSSTPTPPPSDPVSVTTPTSQQNATKNGDERMAAERPPFPIGESKEVLDRNGPSSGSTNQSLGLIVGFAAAGVVIIIVVVGMFLCWLNRGGKNNTTCILAIRNRITNISIQVPPDVENQQSSESLVGPSDPPAEVSGGNEVTTRAVQEERGPLTEEGSIGAAPDETLLKRNGSFCQELNTRNSMLV